MERPIRRKFRPEDKVAILKRSLMGVEAVSTICDELGIAPNQFYRWQHEFFEHGAVVFQRNGRGERSMVRKMEKTIEELRAQVTRKETVIAEITEDYVMLKKSLGEP